MQMAWIETEPIFSMSFVVSAISGMGTTEYNTLCGDVVRFDVMSNWHASAIVKLRLSSGRQKRGGKAGTG